MPLQLGNCHLVFHLGHTPPQAFCIYMGGGVELCTGVPPGQAMDRYRVFAAQRLSPGACSVGAGPTGGRNAFDLLCSLFSAARTLPPRDPRLTPARQKRSPWLLLGLRSGIRCGSRARAGVEVRAGRQQSPGTSPGDAPSAGSPWTRGPKLVPCSLQAWPGRCGAGQGPWTGALDWQG